MVRTLNLDGDQQADLTVHGGVNKAVYAYPSEHYRYWRTELPGVDLPWGMFGENFTTEGLFEETVYIGDRFRIGDAEVIVTEPRMPCYKLGIKFGRADMIKRFLASRRTGFYFAVAREGAVGVGSREALSAGAKPIRCDVLDVGLTAAKALHAARVDVHADHLASGLGERDRERQAHVAQADYSHLHGGAV